MSAPYPGSNGIREAIAQAGKSKYVTRHMPWWVWLAIGLAIGLTIGWWQ